MICPKCAKELPKGKFCPQCGSPLIEEKKPEEIWAVSQQMNNEAKAKKTEPVKTSDRKGGHKVFKVIGRIVIILLATFLIIAALIVGIILFSNRKVAISPCEFITCSFTGYDSMGNARIVGNYNKFADTYPRIKVRKKEFRNYLVDKCGYTDEMAKDLIKDIKSGDYYYFFTMCTSGDFDRNTDLSNGETVNYTFNVLDTDIEKCFKVAIDRQPMNFNVEGLKEIERYDPFELVQISYEGYAPFAGASIDETNLIDEYAYLSFEMDKSKGLKNGDVITVTPSLKCSQEDYIKEYRKLPDLSVKEITVEGLTTWVTTGAEIPSEFMDEMKKQAENKITATSANYSENCTLSDMSFMGFYLLTNKDGKVEKHFNKCVLVYKVSVSITQYDMNKKKDVTEIFEYYYYVRFEDLKISSDQTGSTDFLNMDFPITAVPYESGIVSSVKGKKVKYYYFNFTGVESIDQIYDETVADYLDKYDCEDNISR